MESKVIYKWYHAIFWDGDEKELLEFSANNYPFGDVEDGLKEEDIKGFQVWDSFLDTIVPQDKVVEKLRKKYAVGSNNRKVLKYKNGDYYEGQLQDKLPDGYGELNCLKSISFPNDKLVKHIGKFVNGEFIKGIIRVFHNDDTCTDYYGEYITDDLSVKTFLAYESDFFNKIDKILTPHFGDDIYYGEIINFKKQGTGFLKKSYNLFIKGTWDNDILIEPVFEYKGEFNNESDVEPRVLKKHGKGVLKYPDGSVIKGFWNNDIYLGEELPHPKLKDFEENIKQLYKDEKYKELIEEAENAESFYDDFFKDSYFANKYLWALRMEENFDKAEKEIDRLNEIVDDKTVLYDTIGVIYLEIGLAKKKLDYLNKALASFKSYKYNDVDFGNKRINIYKEYYLKILGIADEVIRGFLNNEFTRIWKVEAVFFPGNGSFSRTISMGTIGKLSNAGAKAFIKATLFDSTLHLYTNKDITGSDIPSVTKLKFDIIEIYEITFNK